MFSITNTFIMFIFLIEILKRIVIIHDKGVS